MVMGMMMRLQVALVILAIVVMTMAPLGHGIADKTPAAVETWFENFPLARPQLTRLHFYLHNIVSRSPPASAPIAQASTTPTSPTSFGLVTVLDGPLTWEPDSEVIGYAQGLFTFCSQEEKSTLMTLNFAFTDGQYKGSTLSVLGRNPVTAKYREFSIVGGSGDFRLVNGIGTASTYFVNATSGDDILEIQVVFYRYILPHISEFDTDE